MKPKVVIIGAGPAGLTAGYLLSKNDVAVVVLEADPVYVGGISRTATYKGFHFDIGGHRFFSKSKAVEDLWTEILPNDMLTRPRSSRIFYGGKFFSYPLKPIEALLKLGRLQIDFVRSFLAESASVSDPKPAEFRRMGEQSIRQTAVQHVLQELHRKSLGDELQGNFRRLGSATDQRPFVRQRNQKRAYPAALQRRPEQSHQNAD
jgi:protoporphyrinogen oxidase